MARLTLVRAAGFAAAAAIGSVLAVAAVLTTNDANPHDGRHNDHRDCGSGDAGRFDEHWLKNRQSDLPRERRWCGGDRGAINRATEQSE